MTTRAEPDPGIASASPVGAAAALWTGPAATAILTLEDVHKTFGQIRAVDGISLAVSPGEIVALLGPNGAGKTTLLRIALGLIRPDRGSVRYRLGGMASDRLDTTRIGYLPEERGLYQDVPVRRYLMYFAALRGMRRPDARRESDRWLERLGLADRANDPLRTLSQGNQQKIQFISSVVHRPELAFLDEPFSGLDPLNQELFLTLIRELRDAGTTVVLSAHHMQLVERLADRIILVRAGRIADAGTIGQLRERWRAGRRLQLRVGGDVDVASLEAIPGVRRVRRTAGDEFEIEVEPDTSLSRLLTEIGQRVEVLDLRSEEVTLHDIYVRTVGGVVDRTEEVTP